MERVGYLTIDDVANVFDVDKKTIYRWERANKIPKARRHPMNGYRVYTKKDVQKLAKIITKGLSEKR